jgi:hypothetical protein
MTSVTVTRTVSKGTRGLIRMSEVRRIGVDESVCPFGDCRKVYKTKDGKEYNWSSGWTTHYAKCCPECFEKKAIKTGPFHGRID